MRYVYVFKSKVAAVKQIDRVVSGRKDAATGEAVLNTEALGWFVHLEGSHEALHVGATRPDLNAGDIVKITIEKVS